MIARTLILKACVEEAFQSRSPSAAATAYVSSILSRRVVTATTSYNLSASCPSCRRCFGTGITSHLQRKLKKIQSIALDQTEHYRRSTDSVFAPSEPDRLLLHRAEWARKTFVPQTPQTEQHYPLRGHRRRAEEEEGASESEKGEGNKESHTEELLLPSLEECLSPHYGGLLQEMSLEHFGRITVSHEDVFVSKADCLLIPMVPNIMPYSGLGLETLEIGGKQMVRELFGRAKRLIYRRIAAVEAIKGDLCDPDSGGSRELYAKTMEEARHLRCGDVLVTEPHSLSERSSFSQVAFCIMPYYWQGGPTDAARRLRWTFQRCLSALNAMEFESVSLPHLADGVYGYEPKAASEILLQQSVDQLLQIEHRRPLYHLKCIQFVDCKEQTAAALSQALQETARIWLPHMQTVPAPVYWARKTQRLLEITPWIVRRHLRVRKLSFKQHHGISRNRQLNFRGSIQPFIWRTARCLEPPPLLLYKQSGQVADFQHPPKPFFERGVSHELFPSRKTGFPAMRVSARGEFVGVSKHPSHSHAHCRPKQY